MQRAEESANTIPPKPRLNRPEHPGCETFERKKFRRETIQTIQLANDVISEYKDKGFSLTLRQLFYQFVSRAWCDNTQREYTRLGSVITDARRNGDIPWNAIEDRTRKSKGGDGYYGSCDDGEPSVDCSYRYRLNPWSNQLYRPQVWIEKDALVGIIERPCIRWDVRYLSCRGYLSEPVMYKAAKEMAVQLERGLTPIVFHLGDHDSSGMQMTEDIKSRLKLFAQARIEVRRLGLNEDQVEQYRPPPNLVKDSDSRSAVYKEDYGEHCWELDALDPEVIEDLVNDALAGVIDKDAWKATEEKDAKGRAKLREFIAQFDSKLQTEFEAWKEKEWRE
jgi:hypothetical protein